MTRPRVTAADKAVREVIEKLIEKLLAENEKELQRLVALREEEEKRADAANKTWLEASEKLIEEREKELQGLYVLREERKRAQARKGGRKSALARARKAQRLEKLIVAEWRRCAKHVSAHNLVGTVAEHLRNKHPRSHSRLSEKHVRAVSKKLGLKQK